MRAHALTGGVMLRFFSVRQYNFCFYGFLSILKNILITSSLGDSLALNNKARTDELVMLRQREPDEPLFQQPLVYPVNTRPPLQNISNQKENSSQNINAITEKLKSGLEVRSCLYCYSIVVVSPSNKSMPY